MCAEGTSGKSLNGLRQTHRNPRGAMWSTRADGVAPADESQDSKDLRQHSVLQVDGGYMVEHRERHGPGEALRLEGHARRVTLDNGDVGLGEPKRQCEGELVIEFDRRQQLQLGSNQRVDDPVLRSVPMSDRLDRADSRQR